jgi:hypothetical protein
MPREILVRDVKVFKLKARGDAGSGRTQPLKALAGLARQFGMITQLSSDDHHLVVTTTKAQRVAIFQFMLIRLPHTNAETY